MRWTVETHPTLRYCRTHKHLYHPPIGKFDLSSADAAEAVAHLNDLMRIEGNRSIVTPIYYLFHSNTAHGPVGGPVSYTHLTLPTTD